MEVNIHNLIDDARCYGAVRDLRWPEQTHYPHCDSLNVIRRGKDDTEPYKQRYACKDCQKRFDDLTNTVFSGHHRPIKNVDFIFVFHGIKFINGANRERAVSQQRRCTIYG